MEKIEVVGKLNKRIINEFSLNINENQDIFCGESNREHMKSEHPEDYKKYGEYIQDIISNPTYIAKHPKKNSIEYIKVYIIEDNNHVLVAVRATGKGKLFARTLFVMDPIKVEKYKSKNALIPY
ncbi:PBECR2 nuclease fold domain-containing protein [Romboutsia sp.]|uniref:PBECR3 domain-containing polyvalent protein n=1 Tax=Romboutsia sp. TaxID=1965302 RepID=UPI003F2C4339